VCEFVQYEPEQMDARQLRLLCYVVSLQYSVCLFSMYLCLFGYFYDRLLLTERSNHYCVFTCIWLFLGSAKDAIGRKLHEGIRSGRNDNRSGMIRVIGRSWIRFMIRTTGSWCWDYAALRGLMRYTDYRAAF